MIYLDNAATSLKKPRSVLRAVQQAMIYAGGYGRSGHEAAMYAGELVYDCRETAQKLFGLESPEQVIFTMNATHALNQAIHALVPFAKKVAVSGYEHNSVLRPLYSRNIDYTVLKSELFNTESMIKCVKNALDEGCDLFIINHISNVFGQIAPIEQIDSILYSANAGMILDASQSAGNRKIDISKLKSVKALCTAGHKGLLGPQGTGLLLVCSDTLFLPLIQGGTGSLSNELSQPEMLPDRLESGTPNVPGIAGLAAGMKTILQRGEDKIGKHEQNLMKKAAKELEKLSGIQVFAAKKPDLQSGVLSFRHESISCEKIAEYLADNGICVRAGLHCAPIAHETAGTLESGTVRISFGMNNTNRDVSEFVLQMRKLLSFT